MPSNHFLRRFGSIWQPHVQWWIHSVTTSNQNRTPTDDAIYQKLTSIFRNIFQDNSITLRPETSESDIAGWDSFSNASLVAAMEKEFAVRFRTAELQSMHNVGSFVDLIRAKLQGHS